MKALWTRPPFKTRPFRCPKLDFFFNQNVVCASSLWNAPVAIARLTSRTRFFFCHRRATVWPDRITRWVAKGKWKK